MTIKTTMQRHITPLLFAALLLPACADLDIPNLNGLDLERLQQEPTPTLINEAAIGLIIGNRAGKAGGNGLVSILGVIGRESYNFDGADPRYRTELLEASALDPGSPAFGGNFWSVPYGNIRNANVILDATEVVGGMSDQDKEAVRGFTKTIQALDYMTLINTRWDNGAAIDVDRGVNEALAEIQSRAGVQQHIDSLLDEAHAHLLAAGPSFPFGMGRGYAGFDTPSTYIAFNRALKARLAAYEQDWEQVLDALDESFLTLDPAALDLGVYHVYSTGAGDVTNGLSNPNLYVHPSVEALAERRPDGSVDDRVARKVYEVAPATVGSDQFMYTSSQRFAHYSVNTAPLAIIRNEELILLAAEAHIGLGEYDEALPYINFVRTESGGLEPRDILEEETAVSELLTQRFYSLLFEGGHRWIDMRRYGRLQELLQQDESPGLSVHTAFPIPVDEQNARN